MISGAVPGRGEPPVRGTAGLDSFIKTVSYPVGLIFLRLIFMVVIPLILSAIILGVAELGDSRRSAASASGRWRSLCSWSSVSVFIA